MRNNIIFAILMIFIPFANVFSQTSQREPPKGSLTSGTIDSQFVYLYLISRTQDGIEHVRQSNLDRIRKNVADTIKALTKQIVDLKAKGNDQQATVATLSDSLQQARNDLQVAQREKDSFSFLGISLQKGTYSLLLWSLVFVLAAALAFYIYRYNQSHVITKDAKKAIEQLQTEFDQHRKKSLEKEQKLKRQLQDELNKRMG